MRRLGYVRRSAAMPSLTSQQLVFPPPGVGGATGTPNNTPLTHSVATQTPAPIGEPLHFRLGVRRR